MMFARMKIPIILVTTLFLTFFSTIIHAYTGIGETYYRVANREQSIKIIDIYSDQLINFLTYSNIYYYDLGIQPRINAAMSTEFQEKQTILTATNQISFFKETSEIPIGFLDNTVDFNIIHYGAENDLGYGMEWIAKYNIMDLEIHLSDFALSEIVDSILYQNGDAFANYSQFILGLNALMGYSLFPFLSVGATLGLFISENTYRYEIPLVEDGSLESEIEYSNLIVSSALDALFKPLDYLSMGVKLHLIYTAASREEKVNDQTNDYKLYLPISFMFQLIENRVFILLEYAFQYINSTINPLRDKEKINHRFLFGLEIWVTEHLSFHFTFYTGLAAYSNDLFFDKNYYFKDYYNFSIGSFISFDLSSLKGFAVELSVIPITIFHDGYDIIADIGFYF